MADLQDLLEMKDSDDPGTRGRAAVLLGSVSGTEAFSALVDMLSDSDQRVRVEAARSLGEQGNPHAVEALRPLLEEDSIEMTCTVITAMSKIGGDRAFAPIVCRLFDVDDEIRKNAAAAIGALHDPRAYEPLLMCLDDPVEWVRANGALSLGKIHCPEALPRLTEVVDSDDTPLVRANAVSGIGALALSADSREVASDAFEYIISVLEDGEEDPKVRIAAMLVFGENFADVCGKDAGAADMAFSDIYMLAGDEDDDDIRSSAIWSLGKVCSMETVAKTGAPRQTVEKVSVLLRSSLDDEYEWCVRYAIEALSDIGGTDCEEAIREFSDRCPDEYSDLCKSALGRFENEGGDRSA